MVAICYGNRIFAVDGKDKVEGKERGMKGSGNIISIDGEKLAREIAARKITKVDASKKIGFSHSYIAGCCSNGRISKAAAKLLEVVLGIGYADIKPEEPGMPHDKTLIELSRTQIQREKIEFYESCEERISNAAVTLNMCLDMIDSLAAVRAQIENDMTELMAVQDVYQKTLKRIKGTA